VQFQTFLKEFQFLSFHDGTSPDYGNLSLVHELQTLSDLRCYVPKAGPFNALIANLIAAGRDITSIKHEVPHASGITDISKEILKLGPLHLHQRLGSIAFID